MSPSKLQQRLINDAPQHPRADSAHGFVNRHDASHFGRIRRLALGSVHYLHLRIHHFDPAGAVGIALSFAVQHQLLPLFQPPREIAAVKEPRVQQARPVAHALREKPHCARA